ncbi:hypothetical protein [Photobacterium halotolerans]|uniref:hypothetical protein n=1 Tax=Photobacterium halotolerans TaxID=265726 RepID=UPI0009E241D0|nr:hypothetical protein [Photobacterium halotolerans]
MTNDRTGTSAGWRSSRRHQRNALTVRNEKAPSEDEAFEKWQEMTARPGWRTSRRYQRNALTV